MDFKQELKKKSIEANGVIEKFMPEEKGYQKTVIEAMNYSLKAGGKRLRPIIILEFCRLFGGDAEQAHPFAAAMEMIHTYSLIHDDLPAIDNDDLRRGKPTNHKMYGEAMAILAGDGLLNYAHELMLEGSLGKKDTERYLKASYTISRGAGLYGMLGGQVVDVESEGQKIDLDKLNFIHMNKTASMIKSSAMAGALIGGADEKELKEVEKYAENIGLAFQIADDILDIEGDEAKLGKHVGSDIENEKATYPSILGMEKSKQIERELVEEAKKCLEKLDGDTEFLAGLADYIVSRDH